jgi:hypothetical protein
MNIITRTIAALSVAAVAALGFAATASADEPYVSGTSVPGHQQQQRQGKVVNHYVEQQGECSVIVNTVGDFGGDPYLDSGQMLNVERCEDGSVYTYHIFHESHPAFDASDPVAWTGWNYFTTSNR